MSCALSITRAVGPPRSVFLDYPLGRTTGKPHQPELQRDIVRSALRAFAELTEPGSVCLLSHRWADDEGWKERANRPDSRSPSGGDRRAERHATPQYQCFSDQRLAEAAGECPSCVFLEAGAPPG